MIKIIIKIFCFIGIHDLDDCDDCELFTDISIMKKCVHCGKIKDDIL